MVKHGVKIIVIISLGFAVGSCSSLPDNSQKPQTYHISPKLEGYWAKVIKQQRKLDQAKSNATATMLLSQGQQALAARLALVAKATYSVDVQYYLYHDDLSAWLLSAALWRAAEKGVRVRILLDDIELQDKDAALLALNGHENISIRVFNPFSRNNFRSLQYITRFGSVTRRMHNKALVADNQLAIIGGRNIGDEYFDASETVAFGDLDVMLSQPAAGTVSNAFDLYWNNQLAYPVATLINKPNRIDKKAVAGLFTEFLSNEVEGEYIQGLKKLLLQPEKLQLKDDYFWTNTEVFYDWPEKITSARDQRQYHLSAKLAPYIESVKKEFMVISPYFVPGKEGVAFFKKLAEQGVKVKILTNSLSSNDVAIVHSGYSKYRKQLLEAGVELYELNVNLVRDWDKDEHKKDRHYFKGSKSSLHAKYYVLDRERVFVGSLNLDPRSFLENTEIGAMLSSKAIAQRLAGSFDEYIDHLAFALKLHDGDIVWQTLENGEVVRFEHEPYTSWWQRFTNGFLRWLPSESQL